MNFIIRFLKSFILIVSILIFWLLIIFFLNKNIIKLFLCFVKYTVNINIRLLKYSFCLAYNFSNIIYIINLIIYIILALSMNLFIYIFKKINWINSLIIKNTNLWIIFWFSSKFSNFFLYISLNKIFTFSFFLIVSLQI